MFIITTRGLVKMFPETNLLIFASHNCGQQLWTNRFWHTLLFRVHLGNEWGTHTHTCAHAHTRTRNTPWWLRAIRRTVLPHRCFVMPKCKSNAKIWSGYYFEFKTCLFDCDHAQPQWLGTARSAFRHYHKFLSACSEFCHLYDDKVT